MAGDDRFEIPLKPDARSLQPEKLQDLAEMVPHLLVSRRRIETRREREDAIGRSRGYHRLFSVHHDLLGRSLSWRDGKGNAADRPEPVSTRTFSGRRQIMASGPNSVITARLRSSRAASIVTG